MSENAVVDRILFDANEEAKKIIEEANQEGVQLELDLQEFDFELKNKTESEIEQYRKKCSEYFSNVFKFNQSELLLELKNQVIENLKNQAIERIKTFDKMEMLEFLEKVIKQNGEIGENLSYNISNIDDKDLSNLEIVKKLNLKVKKDLSIEYGMILYNDIYDKNLSFMNLVNDLFNKKRNEICKVLF